DYGSTIDSVLALDAAHTAQYEAKRAQIYVAQHIGQYVGNGTERYAGPTAKALLMAQAQRVKPTGYLTGYNLRDSLRSLEQSNGRFTDKSKYGDYSNTFSQSLAIIALRRVGVAVGAPAVRYLYLQQCPGGGFRQTEADTRCATASADVDSTSVAVQALVAVPQGSEETSRIARAMTYLTGQQHADGGMAGGSLGENSNTTGLAALAFASGGRTTQASKAKAFLGNLMYGCSAASRLRGLIAYTQATHDGTGRTTEQELKATSQALQGLAGVPYRSVTNIGARGANTGLPCVG
ncbi:MAG: peptidase, partial [Actinomycetota bacterium]|nr:peptidase [Actinomycetota bacterium]